MKKARNLIVECYRNLAMNGVMWSVRKPGRKVLMHSPSVLLRNVEFVVHESGRQRVLNEKRKNVHAFAKGELVVDPAEMLDFEEEQLARYNPYEGPFFTYSINMLDYKKSVELHFSEYCLLSNCNGKPLVAISGANGAR